MEVGLENPMLQMYMLSQAQADKSQSNRGASNDALGISSTTQRDASGNIFQSSSERAARKQAKKTGTPTRSPNQEEVGRYKRLMNDRISVLEGYIADPEIPPEDKAEYAGQRNWFLSELANPVHRWKQAWDFYQAGGAGPID